MKVIVTWIDDSETHCRRTTYVTMVDGKEYVLAPSALSGPHTDREIVERAQALFGADVEVVRA